MKTSTPSSIATDLLEEWSKTDNAQSISPRSAVVSAALAKHSPFDRDVLRLFYSGRYTYEQIAEKVECDEVTARRTRDRAFHQFVGVLRSKRWIKRSPKGWIFYFKETPRAKGPGNKPPSVSTPRRAKVEPTPEPTPKAAPMPQRPKVKPVPNPVSAPSPVVPTPAVKVKPMVLPIWPKDLGEAHRVCKVSARATLRQKRVAYLAMVKMYHPDVLSVHGTHLGQLGEESMKRINRAWELISEAA
jgi:hypothetical protein